MSTPSKRPTARAKPRARGGLLSRSRDLIRAAHAALARVGTRAGTALRAARDRLRRDPVPIEVLIVDPARRRTLRGEIRGVVRRVRRLVGQPLPTSVVVARQVLSSGRELAGATHVRQAEDGTRAALIRAALHVDGRDVADDEVLAVIAEQWIGLAMQYGGHSVLVPVEAPPAPKTTAPQRRAGGSTAPHARSGSDPLVAGPTEGRERDSWLSSATAQRWDGPTESLPEADGRAA